jgi:citrate synthase
MACIVDALGSEAAGSARYALRAAARPVPARMVKVIDAAMSLACERGLTYSSLAARLATVTGNGLAGAVAAAMQTALPHARAMTSIERAFDGSSPITGEALELASSRTLYKDGDPRAAVLLELLADAAPRESRVVESVASKLDHVTVEFAMAGVGWACGVSSGALLLIARSAGWIAHALEERRNPTSYRPRLAYTGPPLRATTPRRTLDAVQQYLARQ